jgi:rhomboid protease GluP
MTFNNLLLLYAALTASGIFARSASGPRRQWDWLAACTVVLATAGAGWFLFQSIAGYVAGGLALVLIWLPTWANNAGMRAIKRSSHGRARFFSVLAMLLHPSRDRRAMPGLFEALELAYSGKTAQAKARLTRLAQGGDDVAKVALAHRLRILARWREIKNLVERPEPGATFNQALLAVYVRALGELGYIDELAVFMASNEPALIASGALEMSLLALFAFTGQVELTRQLLAGARQRFADETSSYWLAVAAQHAGDLVQARLGFGQLRQARDAQIREHAEERFKALAHAEPELPPSAQTRAIVLHFGRALAIRQNLQLDRAGAGGQRVLTIGLIAVNTVVYVAGSLPGLVETRQAFGDRWAFLAPRIFDGEWWRALTYLFVHANALHLLMNMGGLWVLGPFVERAFGRLRFALIYLVSGCTGSAVYLALTWYQLIKPEDLVGASGCIMGLLGAALAVMLRAWIRQRAPVAKQLFFRLLAVVALQVVVDRYTPQIAGLAHVLGMLGGFVCGLLLHEIVSPEQAVARPAQA